jgi:uncharacterized protein (DUF305 family)
MKRYKFFTFFAIFSTVFVFTSCDKDDDEINGLVTQSHDSNKMMTIMHNMMMQMDTIKKTNDPDIDFAKMMIVHHQGAINMSEEELANGKDGTMRAMAQKIKDEQLKEIQEFRTFLSTHQPNQTDMDYTMAVMMGMQKMAKVADTKPLTGNTDQDFAQLMIPHHEGAVNNSSEVIIHGNEMDIKTMADKIIKAQNQEIIEMSDWLINNKGY